MPFIDDAVTIEVCPEPDNLPGELLDLLWPALCAQDADLAYRDVHLKLAYKGRELAGALVVIEGLRPLPAAFSEGGLRVSFVRLRCTSERLRQLPSGLYQGKQYGYPDTVVGIDADGTIPGNSAGQPYAFAGSKNYADITTFFRLVTAGGLLPDRQDGCDPLVEFFRQTGNPPR
jgi:hypothetical protein